MKNHFHTNPLCFRIYADFEADKEIDNSNIRNNRTNIYKQNPVLNGYQVVSELDDILKTGPYDSPLGYNNVDWFVNEVNKLENKLAFFFKSTKKDIIMTDEDEDHYSETNTCRVVRKKLNLIKLEIIVT